MAGGCRCEVHLDSHTASSVLTFGTNASASASTPSLRMALWVGPTSGNPSRTTNISYNSIKKKKKKKKPESIMLPSYTSPSASKNWYHIDDVKHFAHVTLLKIDSYLGMFFFWRRPLPAFKCYCSYGQLYVSLPNSPLNFPESEHDVEHWVGE